MADSVSVDPELLRSAAGRLDVLFEDSGTKLREVDQAIADSRDGWKEAAATAFGRFTTYLEGRRNMLRQNLGELSESLTTAANKLQSQDEARSTQLTSQSSSLDL
ncbi:WXG100 family type VII secretion target [Nocardia amamiensis]|uniref:WXG100 family type VII secretion target n=1 Tax=Nocardia amamiensis TaxID=404578 RepID=A0ABS0D1J8_9NOCA|nr:WXG100 family type VII secretion target [Nocardia amamiensis]MBF6302723.1 WXG100 family type VII secretion target [Nocardia amamiensis]